ncbi:hypothetical protein OEZ85_011711 [Tetradesmus obliquus]|uniref:Uncharacterized protein n=1 Tax=Tetradesmus obliquus TaxID=3088 RepID=A0ABY8TR57_TETOB|nr:hypothetical protein OEZ85_011711 [Tetradesmus obliquus]
MGLYPTLLREEAASRAGELQDTRQALFAQLGACAPSGGAAGAGGAGDEDFQPDMSSAAEEALAAAWAAHQGSPEQLMQLAVDVCAQLGWAHVQPDKAVAELKQIIKQAKKRTAKSKGATPAAAAAAAAGALSQQPSLQQQLSGGLTSSRQSPEPSGAAAAAAGGGGGGDTSGGGTPGGMTPQRLGLAPIVLAAQAQSGGAGGSGSGSASQKQPAEKFSSLQAPSPRLQRCLDAAVAAGAPLEWLQERYPSLRGKHMHQMFRTLCVSGPAGCAIKDMVSRAAQHELNVAWEDSKGARAALKQSLAGNAMCAVAGTTEADPKVYALLCFPGVRKQPAKQPKAAPDAAAAAGGAGQAAAE